jgi:glutaminyl-peptide cyclotransferase
LLVFFAVSALIVSGLLACTVNLVPEWTQTPAPTATAAPSYAYSVVNAYHHDAGAFTQGLVFHDDTLYEGTGLYGQSSLREVRLENGEVVRRRDLAAAYFGEGITVYQDRIIQLTWQSNLAFVYYRDTFDLVSELTYPREGWGITHDGERLIASDGSATLFFLHPGTLATLGHVDVQDHGIPVTALNELEYINGRVYANVWRTDRIAIIDPANGNVDAWIDLSGILQSRPYTGAVDVINGIAFDTATERLFVTGKFWPWLFQITVVR